MGYREIFSHMGGYNMVVIQIATNYTSTNINIVRMEPSARYKEISFSREYMFFFIRMYKHVPKKTCIISFDDYFEWQYTIKFGWIGHKDNFVNKLLYNLLPLLIILTKGPLEINTVLVHQGVISHRRRKRILFLFYMRES